MMGTQHDWVTTAGCTGRSHDTEVSTVRNGQGEGSPSAAGASGASTPIRVVAADDSLLIRESLAAMLDADPGIELARVCSDGDELNAAIAEERPAVVIVDIRMPPSGMDEGIRVAARLRESDPEIGVLVLSQYAEAAYALALLEGGSSRRAYLLKERIRDRTELIRAIKTVAEGGSVIDPHVVDVLIEAQARVATSPLAALTPRERELLGEIAEGKSNAAIAESLVLTKRAVEKHVNSIFSKLGLPEAQNVSRRVKAALVYLAEEQARPSDAEGPAGAVRRT
jgi:DNA-binding NarL/FixJ family response regulator